MTQKIAIGLVLTAALIVTLYQVKERSGLALRDVTNLNESLAKEKRMIEALEVQLAGAETAATLAPAIERLNMVPMTVDREWRSSELKSVSGPKLVAASEKASAHAFPASNWETTQR